MSRPLLLFAPATYNLAETTRAIDTGFKKIASGSLWFDDYLFESGITGSVCRFRRPQAKAGKYGRGTKGKQGVRSWVVTATLAGAIHVPANLYRLCPAADPGRF
ncbi:hypothetical protein [Calidithermus terrae]|uniref:hypothetical protein n=1 Tax=Calidithermus terrae TaxID=1408545 RepID=UPI0011C46E24|nr:hypothetical protein [Calidithermus terrae]